MMDTTESLMPVPLPIEASDRHQAHTFAKQQPSSAKVEQVYRNTLAILVTQRYLTLLGIETNLDTCQSWHPLSRMLENVADLGIKGYPPLDCRPVREGDRTCYIPEAVWSMDENRSRDETDQGAEADSLQPLGHVIVQLDEPYETAQLLGFVKTVSTSDLSLDSLQPLTDLVDAFLVTEASLMDQGILDPTPGPLMEPGRARVAEPAASAPKRVSIDYFVDSQYPDAAEPRIYEDEDEQELVSLSDWFNKQFTSDWQQLTQALMDQISLIQGNGLVPAVAGGTPRSLRTQTRQRVEDLFQQQFRDNPAPEDNEVALVQLIQETQSDEVRWQAAELLWTVNPNHPLNPAITLKNLGLYLNQASLALMVGLLPKADGSILILARVCPMAGQTTLPSGLMLMGTDDQNEPFFGVEARQRDQCIQFKFTADRGDRFSLQVVLNGSQFTESFVV